MKRSIAWHEECLKNSKETLLEKEKEFQRVELEYARHKESIAFYMIQLHEAKRQKKDGFDRGRFMVKQRPDGI